MNIACETGGCIAADAEMRGRYYCELLHTSSCTQIVDTDAFHHADCISGDIENGGSLRNSF